MALNEVLKLVIDGDSRGAVTALKKVGETADKEVGKKATGGLDKFATGLSRAGVAMVTTSPWWWVKP